MGDNPTPEAKIERPHTVFDEPDEVVIDPALSKREKIEALDALEQDARQMATASDEGMTGGEPARLHDVLQAKASLEAPPVTVAYDVVLKDLRSRTTAHLTRDTRALIEAAQAALEAVLRLPRPENMSKPDQSPDGVPRPGSAAELEDEIAREKLDP